MVFIVEWNPSQKVNWSCKLWFWALTMLRPFLTYEKHVLCYSSNLFYFNKFQTQINSHIQTFSEAWWKREAEHSNSWWGWNLLTCSFTRSSSYSCLCRLNSAMEFSTSLTRSSVENCSKMQYMWIVKNLVTSQELTFKTLVQSGEIDSGLVNSMFHQISTRSSVKLG